MLWMILDTVEIGLAATPRVVSFRALCCLAAATIVSVSVGCAYVHKTGIVLHTHAIIDVSLLCEQ